MTRRSRKHWAVLAACGTLALILARHREASDFASSDQVLAAEGEFRWYRGNIHTHTLWSDGDDYPEMVALWYKDHGYDFLSFSDHNTLLKSERWVDVVNCKGGQRAYRS